MNILSYDYLAYDNFIVLGSLLGKIKVYLFTLFTYSEICYKKYCNLFYLI